ncbi:MAG: PDZ domain-containing protein [Anaerolineae bacterium]|nr:PDZ domain-containing protein [Anaerolineae bacterium]
MSRRSIHRKLPILALALILLTLSATAINAQPAPQATEAATEEATELPPEATPTRVRSATPTRRPTLTPVPTSTVRVVTFGRLAFTAQTVPGGLRIISIVPNGPAQRSGLLVNDVITAVEGQPITDSSINGQIAYLNTTTVRATVTVNRAGRTFTATILATQVTPFPTPTISPATGKLGVAYQMVTDRLAADKNLTVQSGAYILEVAQDRPAGVAGVKVGDVITEVEGDKVDLKRNLGFRMIPYNTGDEVTLTVIRGSETLQIKVVLGVVRGIAWAGPGDAA